MRLSVCARALRVRLSVSPLVCGLFHMVAASKGIATDRVVGLRFLLSAVRPSSVRGGHRPLCQHVTLLCANIRSVWKAVGVVFFDSRLKSCTGKYHVVITSESRDCVHRKIGTDPKREAAFFTLSLEYFRPHCVAVQPPNHLTS